jgi:diguanylate cyclase (GGDEF)-like protein
MVIASVATLIALHRGEAVSLTLTHRGRVRLSELKQALRSGREREPLGILWDVRHWETDLEIALLDASPSSPVSVAYLDMNGLKQLNDTKGHAAGDEGLRAYFRSVLSAVGDDGLVYRLAGDEVLAVLPAVDAVNAVRAMERASRRLMSERFESLPDLKLSISAGLVCVTEAGAMPVTVRDAADKCQYRAKEESRKHSPRPSVIALENIPELTIIHVSTDLIS